MIIEVLKCLRKWKDIADISFIIILFCAYSACISALSCILELKEVKRTTKCKEHFILRIAVSTNMSNMCLFATDVYAKVRELGLKSSSLPAFLISFCI
jgi:hypothetical protein